MGQKSQEHVNENLEIMKIESIAENDFKELIKKLTSG